VLDLHAKGIQRKKEMRLRRQQQLDTFMFLPIQPPAQCMEIIYAAKKNEIYANTVNDH
jgi:siroheme synthase (precorrin-2 oxidase/ferrochelatase)